MGSRHQRIFAPLLLVAACRPDPSPILPSGDPVPGVFADEGTVVSVEVHGERSATSSVAGGALPLPLCSAQAVVGLDPAGVCEAVAECTSAFVRGPIVTVKLGAPPLPGATASCQGPRSEVPASHPLWEDARARLMATHQHDAIMLTQLVDGMLEHLDALSQRTESHPQVQAVTARVGAVLDATAEPSPQTADPAWVSRHVEDRLAQAVAAAQRLEVELGARHPRLVRARLRVRWLQRTSTRVGPAPTAVSAVAVVRRTELKALESSRAQRLGPKHPALLAVRQQWSSLPEQSGVPRCEELARAFELRVAYWDGRADAAQEGADRSEARAVSLALARARATLVAQCP